MNSNNSDCIYTLKDIMQVDDISDFLQDVNNFNTLLEEGEIYLSPETLSLAYIVQNDDGQWEVYTNSGHMYRAYDDKLQAQKKAYAMHMWGKKQLEQGNVSDYDIGPPEEMKVTPKKQQEKKVINKGWGSWQDKPRIKKDAMKKMASMDNNKKSKKKGNSENPLSQSHENIIRDGMNDNFDNSGNNNNNNNMPIPELPVEDKPPEEINTIPITEGGKILKEFVLFRDGEWDFAQDLGIIFKVDKEFRNKVLNNFNNGARGQHVPVVDGHDASKKAYGWISKIWEKDNQLMCSIRWNPRGKKALQGEEFGYHSPQVRFNYYDPETKKQFGPTLIELTLTNAPRIKRSSAVLAGFSEDFSESSDFCIALEELQTVNKHNVIVNSLSHINQNQDYMALQELTKALKPLNIELSYNIYNLNMRDEFQNIIFQIRDLSEFILDSIETKYLDELYIYLVIGKLQISNTGERACQAIKFDKQHYTEEQISVFINEHNLYERAFNEKDKFIIEMENLNINVKNLTNKKEDDEYAEKGWQEERRVQKVMVGLDNVNSNSSVEIKVTPEIKEAVVVPEDKTESLAQNIFNKFMKFFNNNDRKEEVIMAVPVTEVITPVPAVAMSEDNIKEVAVAKEEKKEAVQEVKEIKASETTEKTVNETVDTKANVKLTEEIYLAMVNNLEKEKEAIRKEKEALEVKLAEKENNELITKDSIFLEELINEGKMLPIDKNVHSDFIQDLRRADRMMRNSGVQLAENSGQYILLEEKYKNVVLKGASKVVSYGELGSPLNPEPKEETNSSSDRIKMDEKIANEALEISRKTGEKYLDVVVKLAEQYKFNFDLKEDN